MYKLKTDKEYVCGKYRINKIKDYTELEQLIRKNIMINSDSNVKLELRNVPLIIRYQLEQHTNVADYCNLDVDYDNVLDTSDRHLKKILKILKNNILIILKKIKKELEVNFKEINKNLYKIKKILN